MTVFPYLLALVMIQTFREGDGYSFGRLNGKILRLEGIKTGSPEVSISDDSSIRLQFYRRQKQKSTFWCSQVVSIEQKRGPVYEELDAVTISCTNIPRLLRGLAKSFINLGNVIFIEVKGGKVIALFKLPSGVCSQRTYTNADSGIEKTIKTINPPECGKILLSLSKKSLTKTFYNTLFLITPGTTEGSETVGPTYLPAKAERPNTEVSIFIDTIDQPKPVIVDWQSLKKDEKEPLQTDMKPLVLYFTSYSPPSRSVNLVIHALGLPVEIKTINLIQQENLSPDYAKLNPLRTVPAIDDNGFILWESHAIITYLVSKYGKDDSLYPRDLTKRAIVDQTLHYSNDVFYVLKQTTIQVVKTRKEKTVPDELLAKIQEHQANVEKLLAGKKFMAGDSLTVADYSFITLMDLLEIYSPTGDKYPVTKAWFERCKTSMKDFDMVNTKGAEQLIGGIKKALAG